MRWVVVAACALAALFPASAAACNAAARGRAVHRVHAHGRAPLIIGDSTLILAASVFGHLGIEADARGCRQFAAGVQMLSERRHAHTLPRIVILALGANGPISSADMRRALALVGRHRILGLVTARKSPESTAQMRRAAGRHPDRVLLIDWVTYSARRGGGWFGDDGLHVSFAGADAYAAFVRRAVRPFAWPPTGSLQLPRTARPGKACGVVRRFGARLSVHVSRGVARVSCARARALVRHPPLRAVPGWRYWDVPRSARGPWSEARVRAGGRVLITAIAL